MKKILVIQPLHQKALDLLDARPDVTYKLVTDVSEDNLLRHAGDADAITVRDAPLSEKVLSTAPNLRVVSRHGVGFDNIPLDYCTGRGIPVTIVGPVNAISVAEHTMFLMLAAARVGVELDSAVREGRFSARGDVQSLELRGKTLFLVGFGRIGQEVARRASAFGMRIIAFDPYFKGDTNLPMTFTGSIIEGLQQASVVSLHLPLTDETRNILGEKELSLLPPGALVINASRGGLLDEIALAKAVASGALHGAGLDTFEEEPLPVTSDLVKERRIILSPHSAALTEDALIAMGVKTVENVLAALDGRLNTDLVVNKEVLQPQ